MGQIHRPTKKVKQRRCSCCCFPGTFGCLNTAGEKEFPTQLGFVISLGSSCSTAAVVTGILQFTIEELSDILTRLCPSNPYNADTMVQNCTDYCQCRYSWSLPDDEIPHCGPYISGVAFYCNVPQPGGLVPNCKHNPKPECRWQALVFVTRANHFISPPPPCPNTDDGFFQHPCQRADCSWGCCPGAGPPVYFPGCTPPPGTCPDGMTPPLDCPGGIGLLGLDGQPCFSLSAFADGAPAAVDCANYCSGTGTYLRSYTINFYGCTDQSQIRGCGDICAAPAGENIDDYIGDFFIHMSPGGDCTGDYLEISCLPPGEEFSGGEAAGDSTATATPTAAAHVGGTAPGDSTATATPTAAATVGGTADGTSSATVTPTTGAQTGGSADGNSTATATPTAEANVDGTAPATSDATATPAVIATVSGTAPGDSAASATATATARTGGTADGNSTATVTPTAEAQTGGSADGTSDAVADPSQTVYPDHGPGGGG